MLLLYSSLGDKPQNHKKTKMSLTNMNTSLSLKGLAKKTNTKCAAQEKTV